MTPRLEQLRARLADAALDALLVTGAADIYYLCGFSGSAGALVVTADQCLLASDFRYLLQAGQEAPDWPFLRVDGPLLPALAGWLADAGAATVGYQADQLTVAQFRQLGEAAPSLDWQPEPGLLTAMRLVKDAAELDAIRAAVRVTDGAYADLVARVRVGVTERELALGAEWYMRTHGAEAAAFDIIVAAGARSALPHAQPGDRPLQPGDLVVVDMGARVAHYCADMTRTFAVAEAQPKAAEIYRVTWEAQMAGVRGIRAGMTGGAADALTRDVIAAASYGDYFGHGTGHGVGIDIHEEPRLRKGSETVMPAGAAVTIEPGIYLPDYGGVRIEDLVVLTDTGAEVLTAAEKPADLPVYGSTR